MHTLHTIILAAAGTTGGDPNAFWNSSIGGAIKNVLAGIGVIVVLLAAIKTIKDVTGGKPGNAAKTVIAAAFVAAVLFKPDLISTIINLAGDLIGKIVDSISQMTGGGGGTTTTGGQTPQ